MAIMTKYLFLMETYLFIAEMLVVCLMKYRCVNSPGGLITSHTNTKLLLPVIMTSI